MQLRRSKKKQEEEARRISSKRYCQSRALLFNGAPPSFSLFPSLSLSVSWCALCIYVCIRSFGLKHSTCSLGGSLYSLLSFSLSLSVYTFLRGEEEAKRTSIYIYTHTYTVRLKSNATKGMCIKKKKKKEV